MDADNTYSSCHFFESSFILDVTSEVSCETNEVLVSVRITAILKVQSRPKRQL